MVRIKSKSVLRIEFLDSTTEQIVLGDYLRGRDAKGQILAATMTQLYPFALAEQEGVNPLDLEFAFARSIAELQKQIEVMRQYQQIKLGQNQDNFSRLSPLESQSQPAKKREHFKAIDEDDGDDDDDAKASAPESSSFSVFRFN